MHVQHGKKSGEKKQISFKGWGGGVGNGFCTGKGWGVMVSVRGKGGG